MPLVKCPRCGQPAGWKDNPARPFCSERCKLIDFGAWANEEYSVPAEEIAPPIEDATPDTQTDADGTEHHPAY